MPSQIIILYKNPLQIKYFTEIVKSICKILLFKYPSKQLCVYNEFNIKT